MDSVSINWFPGHMAKTRREIEEKIKLVDLLIEVLDARAPLSSRNPLLEQINKKRIIVLTKPDLADESITSKWVSYFEKQGHGVIVLNLKDKVNVNKIIEACHESLKEKREKDIRRGINPRASRVMVVGIPNVGKSSFINKVSGRKATSVENKPGHTKSLQWVKNKDIELLDTPGVLWPKFEDELVGIKLALLGSVKNEILNKEQLSNVLIEFLKKRYPNLFARYGISNDLMKEDNLTIKEFIGKSRGYLLPQGKVDIAKVEDILLKEFRDSDLGRYSLEAPNEEWF